jgi:hypothetical protein
LALSVNTGDWWVGRVGRRVGYREGLAPLDHTSCDGKMMAFAGWGRTVSWVSAGGYDAGAGVKRVLHLRVVDLGVLGARVSGARWVTARPSYRESMFPIATPHGCTRESSTCRRARDGGGE